MQIKCKFINLEFQLFSVIRYEAGPFPELICHLDLTLKNVIIMKIQTFLAAIIIVRYIFSFYSKNPTAVQDHFWTLFLNLWAVGNLLLFKNFISINN